MYDGYNIVVAEHGRYARESQGWKSEAERGKLEAQGWESKAEQIKGQLSETINNMSDVRQEAKTETEWERASRQVAEREVATLIQEGDTLATGQDNSESSTTRLEGMVNALEAEGAARRVDADNNFAELEVEKAAAAQSLASAKKRCKNAEEKNGK